jgi:hypothetical protein
MQHIRRFKLPHGVRVTFSFPAPPLGISCEWDPEMPRFVSNRAASRFEKAYLAARDEFMQDVAQLIAGAVLTIDLDQDDKVARAVMLEPKPIQ